MKHDRIAPKLNAEAFNCVECGIYAKQSWYPMMLALTTGGWDQDRRFSVSKCEHCEFPTIWHGGALIYPVNLTADPPSTDLPNELRGDYEEARAIVNQSPRGAAAILRLVIQKLCKHLGEPGKNINDDIKALVAKGLPPTVQKALDFVRVIGNNAVHPGTIDLNDNREIANSLFKLVNLIVEKMITEPREIDDLYKSLPSSTLKAIDDRDGK